jgi:hypothetical protein
MEPQSTIEAAVRVHPRREPALPSQAGGCAPTLGGFDVARLPAAAIEALQQVIEALARHCFAPFDYQRKGITFVLDTHFGFGCGCILADEQGLGKTIQGLVAASVIARVEHRPALVVAPNVAIMEQWRAEARRMLGTPDSELVMYHGPERFERRVAMRIADARFVFTTQGVLTKDFQDNSEHYYCPGRRTVVRETHPNLAVLRGLQLSSRVWTKLEKLAQRRQMGARSHLFGSDVQFCCALLDEGDLFRFEGDLVCVGGAVQATKIPKLAWQAVTHLPTTTRVLLTGTPINNKVQGVRSLLHLATNGVVGLHTEAPDDFVALEPTPRFHTGPDGTLEPAASPVLRLCSDDDETDEEKVGAATPSLRTEYGEAMYGDYTTESTSPMLRPPLFLRRTAAVVKTSRNVHVPDASTHVVKDIVDGWEETVLQALENNLKRILRRALDAELVSLKQHQCVFAMITKMRKATSHMCLGQLDDDGASASDDDDDVYYDSDDSEIRSSDITAAHLDITNLNANPIGRKEQCLLRYVRAWVAARRPDWSRGPHRLIVGTTFVDSVKRIAAMLRADAVACAGVRVMEYHGSIPQAQRALILSTEFHDPSSAFGVLVMSIQAGGRGLNLQLADTIINYSIWFNPAVEDQFLCRVRRCNSPHTRVNIIRIISDWSIESWMYTEKILPRARMCSDLLDEEPYLGCDLDRATHQSNAFKGVSGTWREDYQAKFNAVSTFAENRKQARAQQPLRPPIALPGVLSVPIRIQLPKRRRMEPAAAAVQVCEPAAAAVQVFEPAPAAVQVFEPAPAAVGHEPATCVSEFLARLGLSGRGYEAICVAEGVDTPADFKLYSKEELVDLGFKGAHARKVLLGLL